MSSSEKKRVRLIHWKEPEAAERIAALEEAGYAVDYCAVTPEVLKQFRTDPPDVFVIDLTRAPSQGREFGVHLRMHKGTRNVPLIFVGGEPAKLERVREVLPDAAFADWESIELALANAIACPPADPVVPSSVFASYANTPLPKKLGIGENTTVALVNAPEGFEDTIGDLPEGARLRKGLAGDYDLVIWFVRSVAELRESVAAMVSAVRAGGVWIAWPKKSSGIESDLSQTAVRRIGLDNGLVDYKICAIDATWSGLKFARR